MYRKIIGVLSRTGAIVVALFIIAASIATVVVINGNDDLVDTRDGKIVDAEEGEMEKLRELIVLTQGAAWWAFILCCFTISAAVVSIIILLVNRHPTATFVIGIIEILLMCLGMLFLLGLGVPSTWYATEWAEPPRDCQGMDCDSLQLTVTNSLQAALSYFQICVFLAIIVETVFRMQS